jgi:ribosomal protein S18 acetylase RimI-like enzyme
VTSDNPPPAFTLPAALLSQGFALRPETEADIPFLMRLFASTRGEELASWPWSAEQKAAFLAQQFQAQRHHYRNFIAGCTFEVIERNGEPVGRFYLQAQAGCLHVVDIALLPQCRGRGIGAVILEALQEAGRASGMGVSTFVEKLNPALRLYRRLGFAEIGDNGVYLEMVWRPASGAGSAPAVEASSGS